MTLSLRSTMVCRWITTGWSQALYEYAGELTLAASDNVA